MEVLRILSRFVLSYENAGVGVNFSRRKITINILVVEKDYW